MSETTDITALADEEAISLALEDLRGDLTPPTASTIESEVFNQAPNFMGELEPQNYGRMYRGCAIVGGIALIITLAVVYYLVFGTVAIPNVVGKTIAQATKELKDAGLEIASISEKEVAGVAEGTVVDQSPRADAKAKKGDGITLVLAVASDATRVPNLAGKTSEEAEVILLNSRLRFDGIITFSETVAEGSVIGQIPATGTAVETASAVTVLISGGPYSQSFKTPKVTGLGVDEAVKVIEDMGLTPIVAYAATGFGNVDEVVAQTPQSKAAIAPKSVVFLLVSHTPSVADTAIPDTVGMVRDEAQSALVAAGFRVETYFAADQVIPAGNIIAQNPLSKDVLAKRGDTIYLLVSAGPDPQAAVADVLGKTIEQARRELTELGFNVYVTENAAALNEKSAVTQQFPAGGAAYNRGLDVVLYAEGK